MEHEIGERIKNRVKNRWQEWKKMWESGIPANQIAEKTGYNHATVLYGLNKIGVSTARTIKPKEIKDYKKLPMENKIIKRNLITGKQYKDYKQIILTRDEKGNIIGREEREIKFDKNNAWAL